VEGFLAANEELIWAMTKLIDQPAGPDQPVIQLSPAEEASFAESLAQADRGEFATDEQVRAIWARHGL
jgi:hypothetical protein